MHEVLEWAGRTWLWRCVQTRHGRWCRQGSWPHSPTPSQPVNACPAPPENGRPAMLMDSSMGTDTFRCSQLAAGRRTAGGRAATNEVDEHKTRLVHASSTGQETASRGVASAARFC